MNNYISLLDNTVKNYKHFLNSKTFPFRVTVEMTNRCNLDCVMCPRRYMTVEQGFIERSLFENIIDQMAEHRGAILVPFFRGESLLHPEFFTMMKYARDRGIETIQFATNGTLLDKDKAHQLIDLEFDFISFSVDSIDPIKYRNIRCGANFDAVMQNIQYFCNLKRKKNLIKPQIQVSTVKKKKDSKKEIDAFVEFWSSRVDNIRVYEEHSTDGNFGSLDSDMSQSEDLERKPCFKPFTDFVIYWNGKVALCNHDWNRSESTLGSVYDQDINDIWLGRHYHRVREAHFETEKLEEPCLSCDHWRAFYRRTNMIGQTFNRS